jgi:uncharacterized membrane protein
VFFSPRYDATDKSYARRSLPPIDGVYGGWHLSARRALFRALEEIAMTKTVVGSFDGYESAQKVAQILKDNGFRDEEISVVASNVAGAHRPHELASDAEAPSNTATGAVTGGLLGGAVGLVANLAAVAVPGLGAIVAAGPLVVALTGAGAGAVAGGLIGALTGEGIPEEHASYYAEAVRRGGAIVTVRADEARADRAAEFMLMNGGIDIDERAARWRDTGWNGFDGSARPYTVEEAEQERRLYGMHADPLSGLPLTLDPEGDNRRDSTIRR